MNDERRIHSFTSMQRGLITRDQLRAAGLTDRMVESRLRGGRLEPVCREVYRLGGLPADRWRALLAGCLAVGGVVAASHRGAADLWGVELPVAPVVDISLRPNRSVRRVSRAAGVVVHRSIDLSPDQIVTRSRIPVTEPHRTLVDLGAVVPGRVVEDALDDMVGRKLVTIVGVRRSLDRLGARGRSGCGVLRAILDNRTGAERTTGRSRLEARMIRLCRSAGLPEPVFQHEVVVEGRRRRLDFAFPGLRLAIEVDGYERHSRFGVFEDDRARANGLELAGWVVLRFTWTQVTQQPDYVIGVLRAALAAVRRLIITASAASPSASRCRAGGSGGGFGDDPGHLRHRAVDDLGHAQLVVAQEVGHDAQHPVHQRP